MSSEETKDTVYDMIGYGSFMTQSLKYIDSRMTSETYNVPVKIVKPLLVKGYRRVSLPQDPYPYIIPDKESEFWGLAFKITGDDRLIQLDRVEGVPYHYTRETIEVDGKEYFIYVASKSTQERIKYMVQGAGDKDYWYTRVYMTLMENPLMENSKVFKPLMNRELCEDEVFKRFNYFGKPKPAEYVDMEEET